MFTQKQQQIQDKVYWSVGGLWFGSKVYGCDGDGVLLVQYEGS